MPPHLLINVYQHIAKVTNTRWNRACNSCNMTSVMLGCTWSFLTVDSLAILFASQRSKSWIRSEEKNNAGHGL